MCCVARTLCFSLMLDVIGCQKNGLSVAKSSCCQLVCSRNRATSSTVTVHMDMACMHGTGQYRGLATSPLKQTYCAMRCVGDHQLASMSTNNWPNCKSSCCKALQHLIFLLNCNVCGYMRQTRLICRDSKSIMAGKRENKTMHVSKRVYLCNNQLSVDGANWRKAQRNVLQHPTTL